MSERTENEIIADVLEMKRIGLAASKDSLLPLLYKEIYRKTMNTHCGQCFRDNFDSIQRWADKRIKKPNMISGKYKFKIQFEDQKIGFYYQGIKYIVSKENLSDKTAEIIKSMPQYAHILEEVKPPKHQVVTNVLQQQVILPEPKRDEPKQELLEEPVRDGVGEQSEAVTVSTSTEQPTGGNDAKAKRGRPSKK